MKPTIEERCKTYATILNSLIGTIGAEKIGHSDETVTYLEQRERYDFWYNLKGHSTCIFSFTENTPLPIVVESLKRDVIEKQAKFDRGTNAE